MRETKNFAKSNKRFFKEEKPLISYYLFSLALKKEVLSDILEYEAFVADKLIQEFRLFSLSYGDFKKFNKYSFVFVNELFDIDYENLEQEEKLIYDNLFDDLTWGIKPGTIATIKNEIKPGKIDEMLKNLEFVKAHKNTKLRIVFEGMTLGSKIYFMKNIDEPKLIKCLNIFLENKDNYFNHISGGLEELEEFLWPLLEFIRDLRNILCHRNINLDQNDLFLKAYETVPRKYKINKFIDMFRDQLLIIHVGSFTERFREKIENNRKIENEIFYEIFSQNMWQSI